MVVPVRVQASTTTGAAICRAVHRQWVEAARRDRGEEGCTGGAGGGRAVTPARGLPKRLYTPDWPLSPPNQSTAPSLPSASLMPFPHAACTVCYTCHWLAPEPLGGTATGHCLCMCGVLKPRLASSRPYKRARPRSYRTSVHVLAASCMPGVLLPRTT